MAYEFVCESEAKRYRSDCSNVLKETCELLKEKGISAQFSLVGSGARNMITRNGDDPYDLDYNLLVMKADNEYRDPRLLKDVYKRQAIVWSGESLMQHNTVQRSVVVGHSSSHIETTRFMDRTWPTYLQI